MSPAERETKARVRTMTGAMKEWPALFERTMKDPTSENLDVLCTLLDVMDHEVCRLYRKPGHERRVAQLAAARGDARKANRAVTNTVVATNKRKAAQAREARVLDPKG